MRLYRMLISLILCALLSGLATTANADDPPKPTDTAVSEGNSEPGPIQHTQGVLDLTSPNVTQLELDENNDSLAPTAPTLEAAPLPEGSIAPGRIVPGRLDREIPDSAQIANDLPTGATAPGNNPNQEIHAASSTIIVSQDFEGAFPAPGPNWSRFGSPSWGRVNCYPIEDGGIRSAWVAASGSLDPCPPSLTNYPSNINSSLVYGPFSLVGAKSAFLDFYFRLDSEAGGDFFKWWASVDGTNFSGFQVSGNYTTGPFNNGYNFVSFDLTSVPTLGDLTGRSGLYVAFTFQADGDSNVGKGTFIDAISLRKNSDAQVVLTDENFDVTEFPNQVWESFDNNGATGGDYRWDDVMCVSRTGAWAMWPADEGANWVDVCAGQPYPNNARSWLVHGPFSLEQASEAWVDFYFRNQSEYFSDLVNDPFQWMVSVNGTNYSGFWIAGNNTTGPYGNGYNLVRFNLSNVEGLGDLRGRPQVWLAFIFESNAANQGQGPFLDDVRVVVERPVSAATYLPVIHKAPAVPQTQLSVKNETSGTAAYTVRNTPQGNIVCSNIAAGTTKSCGTFTSGTYEVTVSTTQCGSNSGEVNFAPGSVTRVVRCVN